MLVNSPRSVSILVLAAAAATVVTSASTARAPGTAASGQHRLRVVLHAGYPIPELGDTGNVVEDRAWLGTVDATATAAVRCVDLKLTVSQLISGVYGPAPVGVASQETVTRHLSARGEYGAYAHQRVPLLAEAFCRRPSGQTLRASVKTTVLIDVPPCTGSLRVLAGKATVNGRTVTQGTRIARGAITSVPRRGRLVLGAPECNGFRVVLPPGVARIGGYSPKARGAPFVSNRLVGIRADGHAGGARAASLPVLVRPNGIDCADCALPLPASFALRADRSRAAVRVYFGIASVVTPEREVRVHAGQQLFIDCRSRPCRVSTPVLFQPGERFRLIRERSKPLPRTLRGARRPPLAALAPADSDARLFTGGTRDRGATVAVVWSRERRVAPGTMTTQKGLVVWARDTRRWRLAYARRYRFWDNVLVRPADVTRDGRADFLVTEWNGGSGFCGPRRVLARFGSTVSSIFRLRDLCETDLGAKGGDLVVNTAVGPCPYRLGGAHCYGGIRHDRMRWDGHRFVLIRSRTVCLLESLDARRSCTR